MKSKLAGILLALVLLVAAPVAAQEAEVNGTTQIQANAGIGPDSPFYGLENAYKRVRLALTFNDENRAERAMDYADERLAEIREMVDEGKFAAAQRARARYEKELESAAQATEQIKADSSQEQAREALETSTRVRSKMQLRMNNAMDIHEDILERHGDKLTQEQREQLEEIFGHVHNQTQEVDDRIERKREQSKVRVKVLANLSDEEADELEANISEQTGLEARLEAQAQSILARMEAQANMTLNASANRSEVAQERLEDVFERRMERLEDHFEKRTERLEERIEHYQERREEVRERFEAKKDRVRGEIRSRMGEEKFRERFRNDRDRDEQEIEVEIGDDRARVQVTYNGTEREIQLRSTDRDEIISLVAQRLNVSEQRVRSIIEFETDDQSDRTEIDIEVEVENGTAYIEAQYNGTSDTFTLSADSRERMVEAIAERTGLSESQVRAHIEFERSDDERGDADETEIEIEVEIENGTAYVETAVNRTESRFTVSTQDREQIIAAIVAETGLSESDVRAHAEFETRDADDEDESADDAELEVRAEAQVRT